MLKRIRNIALVLLSAAGASFAQRWEFGVGAGGGIYSSTTVTRGSQTATTGFKNGVAGIGYIGQDLYRRIGGEVRYTWQQNDLKLESGGTKLSFGAQSHTAEYDLLYHFADHAKSVRPYVIAGGGMKYYQGTGTEVVVQPLSQFAYLTRTAQWKPMFSAGAGIKFRVGQRTMLRVEGRDSMTPFPDQVIAPAFGASVGGWVHDFLVLAGISILF